MPHFLFAKVLIANRGEIALRIVRALHDLGIASVAVYADDDAASPHVAAANESVALGATGPAAYLDGARIIALAKAHGCDAVHPGYGFLSERADFAQACAAAGLRFIGPTPAQLALFGDKAQARALALRCNVPLMPGTQAAVTLEEAQAFWQAQRTGQVGAGWPAGPWLCLPPCHHQPSGRWRTGPVLRQILSGCFRAPGSAWAKYTPGPRCGTWQHRPT